MTSLSIRMDRSGSPTLTMASTTDYEGHEASSEIGSRNVYRLDRANGDLISVVEDFAQPNGLAFSPDERRLFIVDSELHHIRVFNVDHGTLTGGEVFCADDQGYDGIRFDHLGRLWGAAHDGLHCYHPDGSLIGKLRLPEITANLTFGGRQRNHLYITADQLALLAPGQFPSGLLPTVIVVYLPPRRESDARGARHR